MVAQLVERDLAKVEVAGSSPVHRSKRRPFGGASSFPEQAAQEVFADAAGDLEDVLRRVVS